MPPVIIFNTGRTEQLEESYFLRSENRGPFYIGVLLCFHWEYHLDFLCHSALHLLLLCTSICFLFTFCIVFSFPFNAQFSFHSLLTWVLWDLFCNGFPPPLASKPKLLPKQKWSLKFPLAHFQPLKSHSTHIVVNPSPPYWLVSCCAYSLKKGDSLICIYS